MAEPLEPRRKERLEYVHSMLGELRKMADAEQHRMLAYFIDMAYVEAGDRLRAQATPQVGQGIAG